jgi:hypothetical protein
MVMTFIFKKNYISVKIPKSFFQTSDICCEYRTLDTGAKIIEKMPKN